MKTILKSLLIGLVLTVAFSPLVAATNHWDLTLHDLPEETTSKQLRITYSVISKDKSDDFTVELYQNGKKIDSQDVDAPGGESNVFNVTVASAGTYSFKVVATNIDDSSNSKDATDTINVKDAPVAGTSSVTPSSASNTSNQSTATGGRGGGSMGTEEGGGQVLAQSGTLEAGSAETQAADDTATQTDSTEVSTTANDGETPDQAATNENEDTKNTEAAENSQVQEEDEDDGVLLAVGLAVLAAGVGYGAYRYNPSSRE